MAYRHTVFRPEIKGPTELCHSTPHMLRPQLDFMGSLGGDPSMINHCTISFLVITAPYKLWMAGGCRPMSVKYLLPKRVPGLPGEKKSWIGALILVFCPLTQLDFPVEDLIENQWSNQSDTLYRRLERTVSVFGCVNQFLEPFYVLSHYSVSYADFLIYKLLF